MAIVMEHGMTAPRWRRIASWGSNGRCATSGIETTGASISPRSTAPGRRSRLTNTTYGDGNLTEELTEELTKELTKEKVLKKCDLFVNPVV